MPDSVLVEASGNIIKNVKSVVVPNTNGLKGMEAAAAAGIMAGEGGQGAGGHRRGVTEGQKEGNQPFPKGRENTGQAHGYGGSAGYGSYPLEGRGRSQGADFPEPYEYCPDRKGRGSAVPGKVR